MNFLAHLYLSGNDPDLMLGNFIGDHVKGRDLSAYPERVAWGIRLHRQIDHFTDTNDTSGEARALLRPSMGKYAGVVLDIFYDHFLAANWHQHHDSTLKEYVEQVYYRLEQLKPRMPQATQHLFHYMKKDDWLNSYVEVEGIETALWRLSHRVANGEAMQRSGVELRNNYDELSNNFDSFFPQIKEDRRFFLESNGLLGEAEL